MTLAVASSAQIEAVAAAPAPMRLDLSAGELGELLSRFTEVTGRLQSAHDSLRSEVARLEGELRGANRKLRRAEQLAALGEMAAGIAHEIRNPLGSIKLYAKVLAEDLADRPEQRAVAVKIASATDRLNAVVGDVLSFSREMEPRREVVEAGTIVEQAEEACRELVRMHGIKLMVEVAVRERVLSADPGLLAQALTNVVRNACEAIGESGRAVERRVVIGVEQRRVLDASGERRLMDVLVVTDSGPGIPADVIARVFNPFFTTRHTGTGLGLAIVHRIIDAHGGSVVIRNRGAAGAGASEGTVVELLLPASGSTLDSADSDSVNARSDAGQLREDETT